MNKYTPDYSTSFRRTRKLLMKRGYDMSKLSKTIDLLLAGDLIPLEYHDHPLKGNYIGYRECHVGGEGDWLLIYKKYDNKLILVFTATELMRTYLNNLNPQKRTAPISKAVPSYSTSHLPVHFLLSHSSSSSDLKL